MDPTTNLLEQLKLARRDWTGKTTDELTTRELCDLHAAHVELCELVLGLDGWIKSGGFLPDRWRRE